MRTPHSIVLHHRAARPPRAPCPHPHHARRFLPDPPQNTDLTNEGLSTMNVSSDRGAGVDHHPSADLDRYPSAVDRWQPGLARPGCLRRALGGSATRWTLLSGGLATGVQHVGSRVLHDAVGRSLRAGRAVADRFLSSLREPSGLVAPSEASACGRLHVNRWLAGRRAGRGVECQFQHLRPPCQLASPQRAAS